MDIKARMKEHVNFRREAEEVRDYKGYGYTLAVVGLLAGAATGIIVFVLQTVFSSATAESDTLMNIVTTAIMVALLAYLVWLLLPMFKDAKASIGSKVVTTLVSLVCLAVPFIVGIYLVVLAIMAGVVLGVIWLMGKLWSSTEKPKAKEPDIIDTMLGLGGKVLTGGDHDDTIESGGGTLHGTRADKDTFYANGTTYKRTFEGASEVWKEE